jgi:uncharacterized protein YlxW (UPF0749 family)
MNNSIAGAVIDAITGVARPVEKLPVNSSQEIALTSGWLLLGIGIALILFIIFFKKKFDKSKNEQYETGENVKLIRPVLLRSFQKKCADVRKSLTKKGLSKAEINRCLEYITSFD